MHKLLWLLCALVACTQQAGALSEDVGGPCQADEDCGPESFCEEGSLFPQGMCSIECETQDDCILSTVCSERGLCMMVCFVDADCREGYSCLEEERTDGTTAKVCANQEPIGR